MIKNIKDSEFNSEVTKKDGTVLVDFYADWCGPCMLLGPILEEIGNSRAGYNIVKHVGLMSKEEILEELEK